MLSNQAASFLPPARFWKTFLIVLAICAPILAGFSAIGAGWKFNDAKFRRYLQQNGIRVWGGAYSYRSEHWKVTSKCGRGVRVLVEYVTNRGVRHSGCVEDALGAPLGYYYLSLVEPPLQSSVQVAFDPNNPSAFAITDQHGNVPQRNVSRVWRDWAMQNLTWFPLTTLFAAFWAWQFTRRRNTSVKSR